MSRRRNAKARAIVRTAPTPVGTALVGIALAAVLLVLLSGRVYGATEVSGLEVETMSLPAGSGQVFSDGAASGGKALLVWSNATATGRVNTPRADRVVVRARGDRCGTTAPRMVVKVGGTQVMSRSVSATGWTDYSASISPSEAAGDQTVSVSFTNDRSTKTCDRNLRVDEVSFVSSVDPTPAPGSDVFEGAKLYLDPHSNAKRQADEWRSTRPEDAAQPDADWFGDVQKAVNDRVTT